MKLNIILNNSGTSIVLFAMSLLVLMGFASIAVDIGFSLNEKVHLENATDAAALAAGQELVYNRSNALSVAASYLEKNGIDPSSANITMSEDGKSITVKSQRTVQYFFARVLGFKSGVVKANATARAMPLARAVKGVRPFAIENQPLVIGQQYTLKEGGGDGSQGNYDALALGGTGANIYRINITYGYDAGLNAGDYVETETGDMSGATLTGIEALLSECDDYPKCTFDNFKPDCSRIITVVIVDSLDIDGRKYVKIVGFASFFLEDIVYEGGLTEITGRFIRSVASGEAVESQTDYGLEGVKLVK